MTVKFREVKRWMEKEVSRFPGKYKTGSKGSIDQEFLMSEAAVKFKLMSDEPDDDNLLRLMVLAEEVALAEDFCDMLETIHSAGTCILCRDR